MEKQNKFIPKSCENILYNLKLKLCCLCGRRRKLKKEKCLCQIKKEIGIGVQPYRIDYDDLSTLYYELILAVGSKFPDESRHETALRYIREKESRENSETYSAKIKKQE